MNKKELIRTIKYTLFAASSGVIQIGTYTIFKELIAMPQWLSYLVSLILSVIWNFTFNRKFTFKAANNVPIAMLKLAGYYCVFTPLSTLLSSYLVEDALWNAYLTEIIIMLINFITEFLFQRFFVFGKYIDTNDIAARERAKEQAAAEKAGQPENTDND